MTVGALKEFLADKPEGLPIMVVQHDGFIKLGYLNKTPDRAQIGYVDGIPAVALIWDK